MVEQRLREMRKILATVFWWPTNISTYFFGIGFSMFIIHQILGGNFIEQNEPTNVCLIFQNKKSRQHFIFAFCINHNNYYFFLLSHLPSNAFNGFSLYSKWIIIYFIIDFILDRWKMFAVRHLQMHFISLLLKCKSTMLKMVHDQHLDYVHLVNQLHSFGHR